MRNSFKRILYFFIAFPSLVLLVSFDLYNHLPLNLFAIAYALWSATEMRNILLSKGYHVPLGEALYMGGILTTTAYLISLEMLPPATFLFVLTSSLLYILSKSVFLKNPDRFSAIIPSLLGSLAILLYPGLLISYLSRFSLLPYTTHKIIFTVCITYLNDAFAWVTGRLFGKHSHRPIAISPNKSVAGFAGGLTASCLIALLASWLFPAVFPYSVVEAMIIGVVASILTQLGDLAESSLKRSANMKDSGWIMHARGGLLDSADSLFFTIPGLYYLFSFWG